MRTTMVSDEQRHFYALLERSLSEGIARCAAVWLEPVNRSYLEYWELSCRRTGRAVSCLWEDEGADRVARQRLEENVLLRFLWFVGTCPRERRKVVAGVDNSSSHARQVTSSIRAWAERLAGRRIGISTGNGKLDARARAAISTLVWEGPLPTQARRSVMQRQLLWLRQDSELRTSAQDRVFWAIALSLYFGKLRVRDLLGDEPTDGSGWMPRRRTHRGWLRRKRFVEGTEQFVLELVLKLSKTDQDGRRDRRKLFVVDIECQEFSDGVALLRMIQGDDAAGDQELVPLFRDPKTKKGGHTGLVQQGAEDENVKSGFGGVRERGARDANWVCFGGGRRRTG